MMGLKELISGRNNGTTITVPATFTPLEEGKISQLYKDRERSLYKRINARTKHVLMYAERDDKGNIIMENGKPKGVPSLGDEVTRHGIEETGYWGGKIGDKYPITHIGFGAYQRLRMALESLQAQYGPDYPLVQTLTRLTRGAKDNLAPTVITSRDTDIERVVISTQGESPFGNMNIQIPEDVSKRRTIEDVERHRKMLEEQDQDIILRG